MSYESKIEFKKKINFQLFSKYGEINSCLSILKFIDQSVVMCKWSKISHHQMTLEYFMQWKKNKVVLSWLSQFLNRISLTKINDIFCKNIFLGGILKNPNKYHSIQYIKKGSSDLFGHLELFRFIESYISSYLLRACWLMFC